MRRFKGRNADFFLGGAARIFLGRGTDFLGRGTDFLGRDAARHVATNTHRRNLAI